jgi:ArsR family transcriptional regulator
MTSTNADVSVGTGFKVLADPLRRRIVELLSLEQLCTCHLVEETGAGQTTVSNHLRVLREAGMVETEPHGRFTYYRLRPDVLHALARQVSGLAVRAEQARDSKRPCEDR